MKHNENATRLTVLINDLLRDAASGDAVLACCMACANVGKALDANAEVATVMRSAADAIERGAASEWEYPQ